MLTDIQIQSITKELKYHTSRSGGKGGQNVNKVETKVELEFNVVNSNALSEIQRNTIISQYKNLADNSLIKIIGNTHRTQLENKREARLKLFTLINKLLKPVKKRVPTKQSKAAKRKKSEMKKRQSDKKELRKKLF